MKFCKKCSESRDTGKSFCQKCGSRLSVFIESNDIEAVYLVAHENEKSRSAPSGSSAAFASRKAGTAEAPIPMNRYAGFWVRLSAMSLDLIIIGIASWFFEFFPPIVLTLCAAYFTFFTGWRGSTPGKNWMGLKVVIEPGAGETGIGYPLAFARFLSYAISAAPFGLGFFLIGLDRNKKGFHDKITNTAVVYIK